MASGYCDGQHRMSTRTDSAFRFSTVLPLEKLTLISMNSSDTSRQHLLSTSGVCVPGVGKTYVLWISPISLWRKVWRPEMCRPTHLGERGLGNKAPAVSTGAASLSPWALGPTVAGPRPGGLRVWVAVPLTQLGALLAQGCICPEEGAPTEILSKMLLRLAWPCHWGSSSQLAQPS